MASGRKLLGIMGDIMASISSSTLVPSYIEVVSVPFTKRNDSKWSDPCIGYVFSENIYPGRKVVILGDTYDPSPMAPLCHGASLLVHEATDSHISSMADPSGRLSRRTPETVQEKAFARGHSTPEMAGAFARRIGAKALVLNHIGAR